MKILIGIVVVLFLCVPAPVYAGDEAFCIDPKGWEHFDSLAREYSEDVPVQLLHALKIGLCEKVAKNTIRLEAAIEIFNDMVDSVMNKRGDGQGESEEF